MSIFLIKSLTKKYLITKFEKISFEVESTSWTAVCLLMCKKLNIIISNNLKIKIQIVLGVFGNKKTVISITLQL